MGNIQHAPMYRPMTMMSKYKKWKQEICWDSQVVFSSKKRSTSPLVRRDFYRKTIQGGLYVSGESPPDRVQEYETTYLSSHTFYLM